MLIERTFDTGEVRLNYAEGPDNGPPIILLSGFTGRWQAFLSIIPILLPRWHIYAVDYRGHGKSDRTPGHYRAINYLTDCIAFLERQVTEPVVLLGSSAGGAFALSMAALLPETVRAVISLDPPFETETFIADYATEEYVNLWVNEQRLAGRPLEELLPTVPVDRAEELSRLDPEVAQYHVEGRLHDFFADYPTLELQSIACPVLLIQGNPTLGAILSDIDVATAQRQVPRLNHVRLEDKGHEVGLESDAGWVPAMLELLDSV